jgi:hypothetical protein
MSALLFKAMSERHFGAKRLRQRTAGSKIPALVVFCVPRARIARSIAIHIHRWIVLRWLKRTRLGRWLAKASVRGRTQAQPLLVPPPEQNRHRNGDAKWGEHTPAARIANSLVVAKWGLGIYAYIYCKCMDGKAPGTGRLRHCVLHSNGCPACNVRARSVRPRWEVIKRRCWHVHAFSLMESPRSPHSLEKFPN